MEMEADLQENILLGIGNPLLDISATVDEGLLKKYGLQANDAIMAEEKHMPLYKELKEKYEVEYMAGGSVQNTMRIAQWMFKKARVGTYFGCVGDDENANILEAKAKEDGVDTYYQRTTAAPTGTCAVLLTGTNRSLVANLAAAQKFSADYLDRPECRKVIEKAKYFYVSGFFLVVSEKSVLKLMEYAHKHEHTVIFNLSAEFVSDFYKESLQKIMPYVDILMGNDMEFAAFARAFDFYTEDNEEVARRAAAYPKKNAKRQRICVVTAGHRPIVLVQNNKVETIETRKVKVEDIVDTNGAGDAFVGGFLSQLVLGKPVRTSVRCGNYCATHVIQHPGCHFSGESNFRENYLFSSAHIRPHRGARASLRNMKKIQVIVRHADTMRVSGPAFFGNKFN